MLDFTTKRNVHSTQRSHVNAVVLDSSWEQTAAFYLEQQTDHVFCYVRNDRPFLLIPYEYEGVQHHFEPDYVVRLRNGQTLILEMKGEEDDQDRQKYQAARRWVAAVNNWGRLGAWDFAVCRDPQTAAAAAGRVVIRRTRFLIEGARAGSSLDSALRS